MKTLRSKWEDLRAHKLFWPGCVVLALFVGLALGGLGGEACPEV